MSTLQIRIATQSDATHISLLGKITFTETFGHLFRDPGDLRDYLETTFSVAKIKTSLCKSTSVFWIAFAEAKPIKNALSKDLTPTFRKQVNNY